jgi:hypothetical protein
MTRTFFHRRRMTGGRATVRFGAAVLVACLTAGTVGVDAQTPRVVHGRVLDALDGSPVAAAAVRLQRPDGTALPAGRVLTDSAGVYRFTGLGAGQYTLVVERFGYRSAELTLLLERSEPLAVSVLLEPAAFHLDALVLRGLRPTGPTLTSGRSGPSAAPAATAGGRSAAERARQQRFLAADALQLGRADIREANTLAEDDVFRALQTVPGVARRDDFTADLWTRGAPAGQTVVTFDGVPLFGALHALGILSGLNSDMLHSATFQRGVVSASAQGGGAAVIDVESRSPAQGPRSRGASLSPVSARFTVDGAPSERFAWAVGMRRSHLDLLAAMADGLLPGGSEMRYAFADVTARADLLVSRRARFEASAFVQEDRLFGDVADVAHGNEGTWGTRIARITHVMALPGLSLHTTMGVSEFGAAVRTTAQDGADALHPPTDSRYRTLLWDARLANAAGTWRAGVTRLREQHEYNGPGIDAASLLTPESLQQRGITDLLSLVLAIERARLVRVDEATRVTAWGEHRRRLSALLEVEAGVRVETGDAVAGDGVRLAPRVVLRRSRDGAPLSLSAGYARTYQYTQSIARTDVLRSGLRVSELLVLADADMPALRSDLLTVGAELWRGGAWLLGAAGWWRGSHGVLLPRPAAGPLDRPRETVRASGSAGGAELSARRIEGRVRGFANYSLSRSRLRVGNLTYDAAHDRRHVGNMGVTGEATGSLQVGGTFRFESGAPYTRLALVSAPCAGTPCDGATAVLLGTPGAQRAPSFAGLDLMSEWTHAADTWSISVYGQLRNVLGRSNAVTYHSSCVCISDEGTGEAWLGDRFDRGLPRLPVLGLRARF